MRCLLCVVVAVPLLAGPHLAFAQDPVKVAPNDLPNPYRAALNWAQLPDGRKWGAVFGIGIGPDGRIWAFDRCGGNSCVDSDLDPILEFDPTGKLLKSFGAGMFVQPHGLFVDKDGNVWATDDQGKNGKGHQVFKFSPDGKVLMALGKAGVPGDGPDTFNRPSGVVVAQNGDIFVADGHNPPPNETTNPRIVKFSKDGKFIKTWGKLGSASGEFNDPHAIALDSKGRLFVADRMNNRIQIFNQDGKLIAVWKQFGRPSGLFIDKNDTLYVADSQSTDQAGSQYNPGVKRGIRIGRAKDGKVMYFIPGSDPKGGSSTAKAGEGTAPEGVAADHQGNVYGGEVSAKDLKKYVKK